MSKFITAIVFALLMGCATPEPVIKIVEVKVPVVEKCVPVVKEKPNYATKAVEADSNIWIQTQALRKEIEERKAREVVLEAAIESCK